MKENDPRSQIGKRAAAEIRQRAHEEDTFYAAQMARLDVTREQLSCWERGDGAPAAGTLQRMALLGYDVIYILTGER